MKKIAVVFIFLAGLTFFSSCEEDEVTCRNCKMINTFDDGTTEVVEESEYCDDELDAKENQEPVEVAGTTTEWICE